MKITPATKEDRGPIIDSWLKSFRTSHHAGLIPMKHWDDVMVPTIEEILDRSKVLVARGVTEGTQYGWICYESDCLLHYMYVWKDYRDHHDAYVARALVRTAELADPGRRYTYSCKTPRGEKFFNKQRPRPRFNPLPARFGDLPRRRNVKTSSAKPEVEVVWRQTPTS